MLKMFFGRRFLWPRCMARGILVPQPGIEPVPAAVKAWSLNHWTTREVLNGTFKEFLTSLIYKSLFWWIEPLVSYLKTFCPNYEVFSYVFFCKFYLSHLGVWLISYYLLSVKWDSNQGSYFPYGYQLIAMVFFQSRPHWISLPAPS